MEANVDAGSIDQMQNRVALFESGKLPLHGLVSDLEVLVRSLEAPPKDWVERVLAEWAILEEANALLLEHGGTWVEGHTEIQDEFARPVRDALSKLKTLLLKFQQGSLVP